MLGFRVWDSRDKCLYAGPSDDGLFLSNDGALIAITATYDRIYSSTASDRFTPMQSTGLFDQMGKELYESDIIMVGQPDGDYRPEIALVCESIPKIYNLLMGRYRNHPFTIIGNAYENPELLEGL